MTRRRERTVELEDGLSMEANVFSKSCSGFVCNAYSGFISNTSSMFFAGMTNGDLGVG